MKLSIIIGTLNRVHELTKCIDSLKSIQSDEVELVIVNQGVRLPKNILNNDINFKIITCAPGASRSRNIGAQMASGEYIYFFDDDAVLKDIKVDKLRSNFDLYLMKWSERKADRGSIIKKILPSLFLLRNSGTPMYIVKRTVFLDHGGFDERFGPGAEIIGGEDSDLALRMYFSKVSIEWNIIGEFSHALEPKGSRKLSQYAFCRGAILRKNRLWLLAIINFLYFISYDLRILFRYSRSATFEFVRGFLTYHE